MQYYFRLTQDAALRSSLPFFVNSYCSSFEQRTTNYPKGIDYHHLILTLSGHGVAEIQNKKFELNAGDIFFYQAGIPVKYYPKGENFITCWIAFNGFGCASVFEHYNIPKHKVFKNDKVSRIITDFCRYADRGSSDEKLSGKIYSLIIDFCLALKSSNTPTSFENALTYIKNNFSRDIPISELTAIAGVSKSVLFKQFREFLGMTPVSYINSLRIDWAKSYLESLSGVPVEQIAKDVGFSSSSYFIETFKKFEGTTPSKFRKERLR